MSEKLYLRVARELTSAIQTGRYPVGTILPTELELCSQYGTSRHTVRTAVRELQERGLISRKKKAGTRVESLSPSSGYRQSLTSVEDLVQFGASNTRVVRQAGLITAGRKLAREIGCGPGRQWFCVSSLRMTGDRSNIPVGWTDVYIDAAYAGLEKAIRRNSDTLISSLVEKAHGRTIAEIYQIVQATAIPELLAKELKAKAGTPALRIIRRYLDSANEVFQISVSVHPADRFEFTSRLKRERL